MPPTDQGSLDSAVVETLYAEHAKPLWRFLVGLLRDAQLASDVLQATFAKLMEHGHDVDLDSRKSWLFRVAYNEAMAIRRREQVGNKVLKQAAWLPQRQERAPEWSLAKSEDVQQVKQALSQLPESQRQIVQLRVYENMKFAEIAQQLGIPLGTALARMRAGLQQLQKLLQDH